MPQNPGFSMPGVFISTGNPDTLNESFTVGNQVDGGELGVRFLWPPNGYVYQLVILDSATTITPAANQVLWWKSRSTFTVTNKLADSFNNEVAGILRVAATKGNMVAMVVAGAGVTVKYGGGGASQGDTIIGKAGTTASDSDSVAAGTAPTYIIIGTAQAASGGGNVSTNVSIE